MGFSKCKFLGMDFFRNLASVNLIFFMNYFKTTIVLPLVLLVNQSANCQLAFSPGDTALHYGYIKDANVFQKLVWMDSTGAITHTAILNLVTRIDTIQHTVTYLQIRNDGKRDSSVSSYPNLEPIYLSTKGNLFMETYDYHIKGVISVHQEKNGKVTYDGKEKLASNYFESYLGDLVMTTLPVEKKTPLKYFFYNTTLRQLGSYEVTKINQDVILGPKGVTIPIYVLNVSTGKNEFLVYIDRKSHQVMKTVFVAENGSSFVKELL